MGDLFQELLSRSRGEARVVQPRMPSLFEPETAAEEAAPETDRIDATASVWERSPRAEAPAPAARNIHAPGIGPARGEDASMAVPEETIHLTPEKSVRSRIPAEERPQPVASAPQPARGPVVPPVAAASVAPPPSRAEKAGVEVPPSPQLPPDMPSAPTFAPETTRPLSLFAEPPEAVQTNTPPAPLPEVMSLPAPAAPRRKRVEVKIGRIEVRAAAAAPAPEPPPPRRRREPRVSLGDYLSRRRRTRGE